MNKLDKKRRVQAIAALVEGDVWTWTALDADTKMILSFKPGSGYTSAGSLKADLYREGVEYCTSQQREFQPISDRGQEGVPGFAMSHAEIQFRCIPKQDPEYQLPRMEPIPDR